MALVKSSSRFAGKSSPLAGSRSAASKKSVSAGKGKGGSKTATAKSHSKGSRPPAKYSSLKSKQMTVESLKRTIWASLHRITDALITAASSGNLATAKELFHFAGVYALPQPDDGHAAAAPAEAPAPARDAESPQPSSKPGIVHPIDEFFTRIGIPASDLPPQTEVA